MKLSVTILALALVTPAALPADKKVQEMDPVVGDHL
jgi:hypothetical protein